MGKLHQNIFVHYSMSIVENADVPDTAAPSQQKMDFWRGEIIHTLHIGAFK